MFSVDDVSDTAWALSSPAMNRSASEWAFEQFLDEFSTPAATPRRSVAVADQLTASSVASCSVASQSSTSKREDGDEEVVEIKKPDHHNHHHQPQQQLNHPPPPPLDPTSTVQVNSDQYREFLKNQLDLACAAVALSRVHLSLINFAFCI